MQCNRKRGPDPVDINELPQKCQGRPLLLGEDMEEEIKSFTKVTRDNGSIVNTILSWQQQDV